MERGEQPVVVAADVSKNGGPNPGKAVCSNAAPDYGDASTSLHTTLESLSEEPSLQIAAADAPTVAWRSSAASLAAASGLDSFCLSSRI